MIIVRRRLTIVWKKCSSVSEPASRMSLCGFRHCLSRKVFFVKCYTLSHYRIQMCKAFQMSQYTKFKWRVRVKRILLNTQAKQYFIDFHWNIKFDVNVGRWVGQDLSVHIEYIFSVQSIFFHGWIKSILFYAVFQSWFHFEMFGKDMCLYWRRETFVNT